jgi:formate hydrogenlyase subunit 4
MILRLLFHLLLLLLLAPLLPGIIARTKALAAGRRGAPVLQLYRDLWRLFRKGMVLSSTTTWVFRAGPVIGFVVPVLACLSLPLGPVGAVVSFTGDLVLFVFLFGLARLFTVLAALDTGSSFEGMGAAREASFACLTEPTILVVFIVLSRFTGSLTLNNMLGAHLHQGQYAMGEASVALAAVCLFIVILAENCRIPFDDPNTHLELTMIHEVMVLDHSGPDLGLILYGAAMKLLVLGSLVVSFVVPPVPGNPLLAAALFVGALLALAILIGIIESTMARLRLIRVPQMLIGTSLLSFFALILLLR